MKYMSLIVRLAFKARLDNFFFTACS